MPSMPRIAALALAVTLLAPAAIARTPATPAKAAATAAADNGYQLPPAPLQAIVDAPRRPDVSVSPRRDLLALMQTPTLPGIDVVAQPELKLAGLRIHPRSHSASRFSFGTDFWLQEISTGKELRIQGLPQPLSMVGFRWSPDQRYIAFNRIDPQSAGNELWLIDVEARSARRLTDRALNTVVGRGYAWLGDSRRLLVQLQPQGQGEPPERSLVPGGPNVQQTQSGGGMVQIRTYQDMLRNEGDARLLEYQLRSQPALVDLSGAVQPLGNPDLNLSLSASPDGRYLLRRRVERPFSYLVPVTSFPTRIEVLDMQGRLVHEVAKLPLVEGLPPGNDAVRAGVRDIQWRADADATLVWAEAQDGGDPSREVAIRDAVMMQAAPFDKPPVTLARLGMRLADIQWGNGQLALISEAWWKNRQIREWRIAPDDAAQAPKLIREGSYEDRYNDPGQPVLAQDERGEMRLMLAADGRSIYRIGDGASPEGDRPFLDKVDLEQGGKTRLFHSQAPYYAVPVAPLDADGKRLLITRESPDEPTNLFVGEGEAAPRALTRFPHPTPQLKGVKKQQVRYKRKDGVDLTATPVPGR